MGLSAKGKTGGEGWGMGLLLVFFPYDGDSPINVQKKKNFFSSSSASSSSSFLKSGNSVLRSSHSSVLLSKAQSTISICALIVFVSLLLFTLCTFEPTIPPNPGFEAHPVSSRRWLSEKRHSISHNSSVSSSNWVHRVLWRKNQSPKNARFVGFPHPIALQGMGALFRRGTKAMNDLVVGHVTEKVSEEELRLFLRLFHRSGLPARSDFVLIFDSASSLLSFHSVIQEENESFSRLIDRYRELSNETTEKSLLSFEIGPFLKDGKNEKEQKEPLWGKKSSRESNNHSNSDRGNEQRTELGQLSYGSVVGFDSAELEPENSLAGFFDHVPMSLRRWACYPMLLGRLRRNFKHIMLVDVKKSVVLRDPLGRVRSRSPESVYLWTNAEGGSTPSRHGRKNSDKTRSQRLNSAVVMGGVRGVRRLSSAMLVEIVRAATQHKSKPPVSESTALSQLAQNGFMLKNINLVTSAAPIPDPSSLTDANSAASPAAPRHAVVMRGGRNHDLNSIIMKEICSRELEFSVYRDCSIQRD
ncbi:uncharacterized protein LOC131167334 [Malania oleifera]|uniref:uncharacterized protein LOC131167334 n=1 Tax=Malania oleifera TaxID=397392 RepID=UPI0025ADEC32|nr:uncharacterized protein LOC131167334 [Malania oleifera]